MVLHQVHYCDHLETNEEERSEVSSISFQYLRIHLEYRRAS